MSKRSVGSITQDRRGRYVVRVTVDGLRPSLGTFRSKAAAERALKTYESYTAADERGVSVSAWVDRWLKDRVEQARLNPGRFRDTHNERLRFERHIATAPFAKKPLRKLTRGEVVRWVRQLERTEATSAVTHGDKHAITRDVRHRKTGRTLSYRTVRNVLRTLSSALTDAAAQDLCRENVAKGIVIRKPASSDDEIAYLENDEVDALLSNDSIPQRHRDVYAVAIYTGLRAGEIFGLRWADVELDGPRPRLTVRYSRRGPTKTGRVREVPLLPPAVEALRRQKERAPGVAHALVFAAKGGRMYVRGYDARWKFYGPKDLTFRDLRHTCATHLVSGTWGRTWTLEEVKMWLGHTSITTTEKYYARFLPDSIHRAADEARQRWTGDER